MPILDYVWTHDVFTTRELLDACGDTQTNRNLLSSMRKGGRLGRTHGVWWVRGREVDRRVVLAKAYPGLRLTYHSALEALGLAHTVIPRLVTAEADVSSPRVLTIGDATCRVAPASGFGRPTVVDVAGQAVSCDNVPTAIIRCLRRPSLAGGVEELARSVANAELDEGVARMAAALCSKASDRAKLGSLLSHMGLGFEVSGIVRPPTSGTYYLSDLPPQDARAADTYRFDADWRVYVPRDLGDWLLG